jgi:hypothetical protein
MDAPFHNVFCETLVSEKPEGCDAFGLFHLRSYWLIVARYWLCKSLKFNALKNIITIFI